MPGSLFAAALRASPVGKLRHRYREPSDASRHKDPQLMARGLLSEMQHRDFGTINFPQGAIATALGKCLAAAPKLGEHNAEIFSELKIGSATGAK